MSSARLGIDKCEFRKSFVNACGLLIWPAHPVSLNIVSSQVTISVGATLNPFIYSFGVIGTGVR